MATRIQHLAKRVYRALDLTGYARIDLRMDADGRIYVIEANPNPQLAHGEDFAESAKRAKVPYGRAARAHHGARAAVAAGTNGLRAGLGCSGRPASAARVGTFGAARADLTCPAWRSHAQPPVPSPEPLAEDHADRRAPEAEARAVARHVGDVARRDALEVAQVEAHAGHVADEAHGADAQRQAEEVVAERAEGDGFFADACIQPRPPTTYGRSDSRVMLSGQRQHAGCRTAW